MPRRFVTGQRAPKGWKIGSEDTSEDSNAWKIFRLVSSICGSAVTSSHFTSLYQLATVLEIATIGSSRPLLHPWGLPLRTTTPFRGQPPALELPPSHLRGKVQNRLYATFSLFQWPIRSHDKGPMSTFLRRSGSSKNSIICSNMPSTLRGRGFDRDAHGSGGGSNMNL